MRVEGVRSSACAAASRWAPTGRSGSSADRDPFSVARALAEVVAAEIADLVLCGVQSSDAVQASTGMALAELLGLPRVAVVTRLDYDGAGTAVVDRELEGGLVDRVEVDTPAVLTIQTGINEPRYANLRAIKQAEQVEIDVAARRTAERPPTASAGCSSPSAGREPRCSTAAPRRSRPDRAIVKERLA